MRFGFIEIQVEHYYIQKRILLYIILSLHFRFTANRQGDYFGMLDNSDYILGDGFSETFRVTTTTTTTMAPENF